MYNDYQIPSIEEFALLAKEYSNKLEQSKKEENSKLLLQNLYELNFLYSYIKKNVRINKIFSLMEKLEHQTILDISDICSCLNLKPMKIKYSKTKYNNLRPCLKRAINLEAEILTCLIETKLIVEKDLFLTHIDNISQINKLL